MAWPGSPSGSLSPRPEPRLPVVSEVVNVLSTASATLLCGKIRFVQRFLAVQRRGTVALPPDTRKRFHLDAPGAQVEMVEREDGVIELRPYTAVPTSQTWFWGDRWQAMEREVDEHVAAGRVVVSAGPEEFFSELDSKLDQN
jgi:bifunctional DNA-binding transcriptional regulator/antitoxin component of YhaV-PrlF toxin-antitoxin module